MPLRTDVSENHIPSRARPQSEAQLVILYMLDRLGPVTDANLLDFLTEAGLMNYLEMMPALGRLCQEGAVSEAPEGAFRRYQLEAPGREFLAMYLGRIPHSDRETVDRYLPEWQAALRVQRDYQADMAQTPKGDFDVSLRMMERGRPVMTVTVNLPSSDIAARLCRRWQEKGGEVYGALLRPLMEEEQP